MHNPYVIHVAQPAESGASVSYTLSFDAYYIGSDAVLKKRKLVLSEKVYKFHCFLALFIG